MNDIELQEARNRIVEILKTYGRAEQELAEGLETGTLMITTPAAEYVLSKPCPDGHTDRRDCIRLLELKVEAEKSRLAVYDEKAGELAMAIMECGYSVDTAFEFEPPVYKPNIVDTGAVLIRKQADKINALRELEKNRVATARKIQHLVREIIGDNE